MSSKDFPLYPQKGDYVRFACELCYEKKPIIKNGEIGLVTEVVYMKSTTDKTNFKQCYIEVALTNGQIWPVNFSKFIKELEVIPINSPAYRVLYGQSKD